MQKRFSTHWKTISATGMVMLIVLTFLSFAGGAAGAQEPSTSRTINVSGSGEAFGSPDIAYINLGVDVADADISAALDKTNTTMEGIIKALGDAGVDAKDIQTVNFSVYPEDKYDPQTGQATGERVYHVNNSVNVTVRDIAKVGGVMKAGLDAGANSVNGLNFGIADTKALEAEARKSAVADARDRAQQLADAFGVTLGEVISVSESFGNGPVQPLFGGDQGLAIGGAAPQISTGQLSVSVQVSVTFAIGK